MDELTYEQKTEFRNATHCSICNKKFQPDDTKVQDHCHFTGKYRGAAHVKCNLDYSFRYFKIPIFFHNLKNYDAHLIIAKANELNIELNQNKRIDVIAQNSEKFITFSFGACQFKDSFAFLTASLDKLVRLNKYEGNEKIKNWETRSRYTSTNPYIKSKTDLNLLTEKGVYPYDYDILGLHILAPSKFSCTQAPSCLNSLRVSFKALWTVSSDSLVVLVSVCNILCHHLVLRDFLQSFSFAVAFKFRRSLDACISFHLDIALLLWRYTCPCHIERTNCLSDFTRLGDDHNLSIFEGGAGKAHQHLPILTEFIVKDVVKNQLQANSRVGQDLKKVFCNSWQKSHLIYVKKILEVVQTSPDQNSDAFWVVFCPCQHG